MVMRRYFSIVGKRRYIRTAVLCFIVCLVALVSHRPVASTREALPQTNLSIADFGEASPDNGNGSISPFSFHGGNHELRPRVDSDAVVGDWAAAVAAGNQFFCFMAMTKKSAEKWVKGTPGWKFQLDSTFHDPEVAEDWGWGFTSDGIDLIFKDQINAELSTYMKQLKLEPEDLEAWASHYWRHVKAWKVTRPAGSTLPSEGPRVSRGSYLTHISKDKGNRAMIVDLMFSPGAIVKSGRAPGPAPDLGQASDMWFLQYYRHGQEFFGFPQKAAMSRILPPQHIFIQHIITPEVKALLERLVTLDGNSWPDGKRFDGNSEQGMMVMGTAHGKSVSWFLIQHKDYFGDLTVNSIRIWHMQGGGSRWHVYFEIVEAETDGDPEMRAKL
ncbi:hypothetical protein EG328_006621 [Venturia inaequalis]|uniref:Uncharacterized protein n=1 Tax=Venturia inaequalis TaxID=5025 RepID=A0A8H3UHR9_VENIN|nr:hypothetical protein EG328_006621 [Venturia inaequalis]